jgi:hypothetical protein
VRPDNTDEDLGSATGLPPFDGCFSSSNPNTDEYEDNVEGQSETQEVRNQEDEPEVRAHTESREPNKERLESNQIKIDEVRDQNEHIELTEEREEGEVIDSENENESKNFEQNEKQNTFAEDLIDVLTVENDKSQKSDNRKPNFINYR